MHPNSTYRKQTDQEALELAEQRGFGVITAQLEGLFGAHVPFLVSGDRVHLHLNRANPLAKAAREQSTDVMLIVSLCDAYVSPEWYDMGPDQVPTWIYAAVHIHGTLRPLPDETLEPLLSKLSAKFEARLTPKMPWTLDKVSEKAKLGLMRAIQPFELEISEVEATDKFAQNKTVEALDHLAPFIAQDSFGANTDMAAARVAHHRDMKSK